MSNLSFDVRGTVFDKKKLCIRKKINNNFGWHDRNDDKLKLNFNSLVDHKEENKRTIHYKSASSLTTRIGFKRYYQNVHNIEMDSEVVGKRKLLEQNRTERIQNKNKYV